MRKRTSGIILVMTLVFAAAPLLSAAQDEPEYCAFQIHVRSPTGAPVKGVSVALLKRSGETFGTAVTDEGGVAKICDAPGGLVDVEVGGQLCGAIAVRHLKAFWMKTRRVFITYENCSGEEFVPMGGCLLTIRTLNESGLPIRGVLFDSPDKGPALRPQTSVSDRFGRIFRFIRYGEILTGHVEKPGYATSSVTDECKSGQAPEREQVVVLTRK